MLGVRLRASTPFTVVCMVHLWHFRPDVSFARRLAINSPVKISRSDADLRLPWFRVLNGSSSPQVTVPSQRTVTECHSHSQYSGAGGLWSAMVETLTPGLLCDAGAV